MTRIIKWFAHVDRMKVDKLPRRSLVGGTAQEKRERKTIWLWRRFIDCVEHRLRLRYGSRFFSII